MSEADQAYGRALAIQPGLWAAWSNRLMVRAYDPGLSPAERLGEASAFGRALGVAAPATWTMRQDPDRRPRVGLVSADFAGHAAGHFLRALFAHRDPAAIELVAYANQARADTLTQAFRASADAWRDVAGISDPALLERIRADGIDILIDLSGHSAGNRLAVFALRAAPVQATWLGFPATTGVAEMDWLIADRVMVPAGAEGEFTERVARLSDIAWCYTPPDDAPAVVPSPCLSQGHVTFASFSFPAKLNEPLLRVWAALLQAVPGARLLLKYVGFDDALARDRVASIMAAAGIGADRLDFAGWTPDAHMLAAYGTVDIALDPFPFAGGTTTCEALWMGVPVVTQRGAAMAGRTSAALLQAAGLGGLVAKDAADYVALAAALAGDTGRLASLRASLRPRLAASPVTDGPRFARAFEGLLRAMWQGWCKNRYKKV